MRKALSSTILLCIQERFCFIASPYFSRPDTRVSGRVGTKRKLRLNLDAAQYYTDMKDGCDCYEYLNLLIRRKSKENNFHAVLRTIRELMNITATGRAVPTWLHDVLLGYGSPAAANYK